MPKENNSRWLSKKGLKLGCLNVNHLSPKFDEITFLLKNEQNFDLFGIVETFLSDEIDIGSLQIEGYKLERKDRGTNGGGLVTYIDIKRCYKRRDDIETDDIESLWI